MVNGNDSEITDDRVGPLILRYVNERAARGELRAASARTSREVLNLFAQSVGFGYHADKVTRHQVERWLEKQNISQSTRRLRLSIVRSFFNWAVSHHHCHRDPTKEIRAPKEPRRLPRGLRQVQIERTLASAVGDLRAQVCILLGCQEGLRAGEMARMQMGDIDWTDRVLLVQGKGGHQRLVPISDETWSAMQRYLSELPPGAGAFLRSKSDPHAGIGPASVYRLLSAALREAGVAASSHALRHSMAADMLRQGANVRDVQQALGHQSLATTQVYLGFASIPELRKAMGGRHYGGSLRSE